VNTPSTSIKYHAQPQARVPMRAALLVCASMLAVAVAMIAFVR
jgi:hypothetical protein